MSVNCRRDYHPVETKDKSSWRWPILNIPMVLPLTLGHWVWSPIAQTVHTAMKYKDVIIFSYFPLESPSTTHTKIVFQNIVLELNF